MGYVWRIIDPAPVCARGGGGGGGGREDDVSEHVSAPMTTTTTTMTTTTKRRTRDDVVDDAVRATFGVAAPSMTTTRDWNAPARLQPEAQKTRTKTTTTSNKKTKTKKKPSASAAALSLAFEPGRGDCMEPVEFGDWIDVADDASVGMFMDAASRNASTTTTSENGVGGVECAMCVIGVLTRDVVNVGDLDVWFGFASNMRIADADERKLATSSAKTFAKSISADDAKDINDDDGGDSALASLDVRTECVGFGVMFADNACFFLQIANGPATRTCIEHLIRTSAMMSTYHAQRVIHAMCDASVVVDASTVRMLDCRVDAWLIAPDVAHDGGIDDVVRVMSNQNDGNAGNADESWSANALACFRRDLMRTREACVQGTTRLERAGVTIARSVESRVAVVLGTLQFVGVGFDRPTAMRMRDDASERLDALKQRARAAIGMDINLSSARQVGEVLYDTLKLPLPSATASKGVKTNHRTTKDDVLAHLAQKGHEFPKIILEHRSTLKERAMCDGYARFASDGRIRTEWNNTKTATGRLSSSNPNIQQVSNASKGVKLREAFVPRTGRVFLAADYSQIELRCLAHVCGDARLISLLNRTSDCGGDVFVAIWNAGKGYPLDAPCDKHTRDLAKRTAYAIVYGQHVNGLAEKLNIPREQANEYFVAFHQAFPAVKQWINATVRRAEQKGAVVLPMSGRHRALPNINSPQFGERSEAQRQAVNSVIQGTAADMMKCCMLRWASAIGAGAFSSDIEPGSIDGSRVQLVAQIHDELLFEVDEDYVDVVAAAVRACMERAMTLAVPTPIKMSLGKNWGTMRDINDV